MKRRTLTGIVFTVLLAALRGGPAVVHAQGCAVDAAEASVSTGARIDYLGVETPHYYDNRMPFYLEQPSQTLIYAHPANIAITTTDLPATGADYVGIGGDAVDAETLLGPTSSYTSLLVSQANGYASRKSDAGAYTWVRDVGRGGSCTSDSTGKLALQLRSFSTSGFQSTYNSHLLYVGTRYNSASGCTVGQNTDNKVYALDTEDGLIVWTFNAYNGYDLDGVFGLAIDKVLVNAPAPNAAYQQYQYQERLYVTTERRGPSGQHSVWSINTLNGNLVWSVDAGRIETNPIVRGTRLYVTTVSGDIKALDKTNGSELWSLSIFLPFLTDFDVGRRAPYDNLIALVDYFGDIRLLRDDGSSVTPLWTTDLDSGGGEHATTVPFFDDVYGYIYVGASDGKLYQLDVATGTPGPTRTVDIGGDDVVELIRYAPENGSSKHYTNTLFAATDTTNIARFCTPFMYPPGTLTPDGDINTDGAVNVVDVLVSIKALIESRLLNPTEFGHADVAPLVSNVPNPDGTFDLGDIMLITRKALIGSF